jgi:hypothetical protein
VVGDELSVVFELRNIGKRSEIRLRCHFIFGTIIISQFGNDTLTMVIINRVMETTSKISCVSTDLGFWIKSKNCF